jgi:hypothetical protein
LCSGRITAEQGPDPEQAVAEALSALEALAAMGMWPGPRDPANEAAVIELRQCWARLQRKARFLYKRGQKEALRVRK